jgi:hypothetical protein
MQSDAIVVQLIAWLPLNAGSELNLQACEKDRQSKQLMEV